MEPDGEHWDKIWSREESFDENIYFQCVVDSIIEIMGGSVRGLRVLEAGAGTGTTSLQLAIRGASPALVDYSPVAVEKMKEMFKRNKVPASYFCEDVRALSSNNGSYDLVFNSGVLEHFPFNEQVKILAEMKRVCKPSGRVIVFTPNARCLFYRLYKWFSEKGSRLRHKLSWRCT
jgi:2-polyprenyl-3-methyl-5-hydroxy-6-metoxy-1,4-benzoquinol methylase